MSTPDISVIIPVYNAGRFIDRTMRNMIDGQFGGWESTRWEIIAVNDGSTDGSADILGRYAKQYPGNVRIISIANSGVSVARNTGITEAGGRYLYFMDADDLMSTGALPALTAAADRTGADILRFGHTEITPEQASRAEHTAPTTGLTDLHTSPAREFLDQSMGMIHSQGLWAVWGALFSRGFVERHRLRFTPGLPVGEDCVFTWQAMLCSPTVTVTDRRLYFYIRHQSSAINDTDRRHIHKMMEGRQRLAYLLIDLWKRHRAELPPRAAEGLLIAARNAHNESLADAVIIGEPLSAISRSMKRYKAEGMTLKPGRPKFYIKGRNYPLSAKLRRWLAAYPIPVGIGLADLIHGRGLWNRTEH